MDLEHDDRPTDQKCTLKCSRCGRTVQTHRFEPLPGKCAERCAVCGEERDYMKIALDETKTADVRADAVGRLKKASMLPEQLKKNCAEEKHIWVLTKSNPQQFQGGASSETYTCIVCGKTYTEVDWGN